jgi:hypothetical protein
MAVPHWRSTPWQEGTRVETANVRIWLSSYTATHNPDQMTADRIDAHLY